MNAPPRARRPDDFGAVVVLYGGDSAEREVSLRSGEQVAAGLERRGVVVRRIDKGRDLMAQIAQGPCDRVFIALHGRGGEDGTVQGALEVAGIAFTGAGVLGSALAMDKRRAKLVWRALGIATPDFRIVHDERDLGLAAAALGYPLAVKPVHEGSSIGMSKVRDDESLHTAWFAASRFDRDVMVEPWLPGPEYTVAILGEEALPTIRVETPHEFYDYEAKYADGAGTRYICPCGLPDGDEQALRERSLEAFAAVGASGWGRVDLLMDAAGRAQFLDVNTAPGMTTHSLVPMAAKAAGIDFDELVWRILETTL